MRILLVEDSERVVAIVAGALRTLGHVVVVASSVSTARATIASLNFDVAVVDVGLPDGSGLDWCRGERRRGCSVPILMLTARGDVESRVEGLDAGADDYVGKPFAIAELVARVRALARRGPRWTESVRSFGRITIDRDRRAVLCDGERVPLTARELDIVALLAWRDGRVAARDDILEGVWGDSSERAAASFEVLLARIRRKLEARGVSDAVRTVRQVGYAWALARSSGV